MPVINHKPIVPLLNRRLAENMGLVSAVPFSEGGGPRVQDTYTTERISITGSSTWTKSPWGPAITFTGGSNGVPLSGPRVLSVSGDLTISGTFRTAAVREGELVSNNNGGDGRFSMKCSSLDGGIYKALVFVGKSSGNFLLWGTTATNDGAWHHMAAVRKTGTWYLYIDGKLQASGDGSANPLDITKPLYIGRNGTGDVSQSLQGSVGNVEIFNRALTPTEVALLAADPLLIYRPDPPRVFYSYPSRPKLVLKRFV